MDIKTRLYLLLVMIFLVVLAGSTGYYILNGGEASIIDCVYMTVISITSVGYGEGFKISGNVPAQLFTMLLITFGMGVILYSLSTLTVILIEGELSGILRKNKMNKMIQKLENHYIVCGGGETGRPVLMELFENGEKAVLIEMDDNAIEGCKAVMKDLLYIQGDTTEDVNLVAAGIEKAAGVIICLPLDKDNLYVTMTARMLNPKVRIVSRMINQSLRAKIIKAGADRVVSPDAIGALRMASIMIRPTVVDFLDSMLRSGPSQYRIHQITISKDSHAVGKTIAQSGLKDTFGLLILGTRKPNNEIDLNPHPTFVLKEGMTLIVMGMADDIAKAKSAY
ncbi:MAG: potassium channel protein [Desulfobacterales bacterium]|nr:potassium channel protein [Desulfobacterales bacterium]